MVQLVESDIKTREVLDWKGVHVLHFMGSSCSQKLRVFLNLKGIPWESHHVDLMANENFRPWFLGINPRGLVPVLVHDGAVHIESNDIITYLEKTFPQPRLIPEGHETEGSRAAMFADSLHPRESPPRTCRGSGRRHVRALGARIATRASCGATFLKCHVRRPFGQPRCYTTFQFR